MDPEEYQYKQTLKEMYDPVRFDFDQFDSVAFLVATMKLKDQGAISQFDYEYESETDVFKALTCVELTTPKGHCYTIKFDGELHISFVDKC